MVEGLRTDSLYIPGTNMRVSQWLSGALVIVCAALLVYFLIRAKKNPQPIEGIDYYIDNENRRIELVNGKPIPPKETPEQAGPSLEQAPADGEEPEEKAEQEADEDGDQD